MGYWDATDNYLQNHGGHGPNCPACGKEMFAEDDHGRFKCFCGMEKTLQIPQIGADGMTDEQKSKIPALNRLYSEPTEAEKMVLTLAIQGKWKSPEYIEACKALDKEREGN